MGKQRLKITSELVTYNDNTLYLRKSFSDEEIKRLNQLTDKRVRITIKEIDILDDQEKQYLRAIITPFRTRVKNIAKIKPMYDSRFEYIRICVNSISYGARDYIDLPYFEENTKYKGMKINKEYTLEELDL